MDSREKKSKSYSVQFVLFSNLYVEIVKVLAPSATLYSSEKKSHITKKMQSDSVIWKSETV